MLSVGTKAPDFSLPDQNGTMRSLSDFSGKRIVLYFYSKDMTSGCTKQACGFAELYPQFTEKGAEVIGISKDSQSSHRKFKEKFHLAFTLLSDPDAEVIQKYDAWKEKSMYGRKYFGTVRSTYLIDEDGIIIRAFEKVKPSENPGDMLKELEG